MNPTYARSNTCTHKVRTQYLKAKANQYSPDTVYM